MILSWSPAPTLEDVRSWTVSFEKVMKSAAGRGCFRQFLRTEFSEENMMFWLACEDLKKETNKTVVEEKVRQIYEDFISILSPKEVSRWSRAYYKEDIRDGHFSCIMVCFSLTFLVCVYINLRNSNILLSCCIPRRCKFMNSGERNAIPTLCSSHFLQVSLDSRVREVINRNMLEPTSCTFDDAQQQIYTLMQRDSYPRFINSTAYTDLLKNLEEPPPEP